MSCFRLDDLEEEEWNKIKGHKNMKKYAKIMKVNEVCSEWENEHMVKPMFNRSLVWGQKMLNEKMLNNKNSSKSMFMSLVQVMY